MNMKKCIVCGKEFKPYRYNHKFCSVECQIKHRLSFQREKRETAKKLHLCTRCGVPLEEGSTRTRCESCREKERARAGRKSKALQEEKLTAVLCEIDRYNKLNSTHLTYGQYMLKKRNGEIT